MSSEAEASDKSPAASICWESCIDNYEEYTDNDYADYYPDVSNSDNKSASKFISNTVLGR
jgi:hypothetical protein